VLTRRFHVSARAVHLQVSSPTSYRWLTQAPRPLYVVLTATNHTPVADEPWYYTVRVTSSKGTPVSATVYAQVLFQGQVVGQIDNAAVHSAPNGVWTEDVTWPLAAVDQPLVMQVVVTALGTTRRVNYPITVASS
jgi:hypothetical protein